MSGADQMRDRRWSTRQRLVVLTFDTKEQAHTFDLLNGPPITSDHGGFDIKLVDSALLDVLLWEVRQLLDQWDDGENRIGGQDWDRLEESVTRVRASLFELRQGAMS